MPATPTTAADHLSARFFGEGKADSRDAFARDRDRVLYAPEFTRLGGITQVVDEEPGVVLHNRLTHSLKVAQVARRISERVRANSVAIPAALHLSPDAVEACALAHDLGHPPFGHAAEAVLDEIAHPFGGFNGNAQSLRIVARLSGGRRDRGFGDGGEQTGVEPRDGLNLSRSTLAGILKYPHARNDYRRTDPFGFYEDDRVFFDWITQEENAVPGLVPPGGEQSLSAQIMDWADDVTYAVHDMADFFRAGLIPLKELTDAASPETDHFKAFLKGRGVDRLFDPLLDRFAPEMDAAVFGAGPLDLQAAADNLHTLSSGYIGEAIETVDVTETDTYALLAVPEPIRVLVDMLKQLVRCFVIENQLSDLGRRQRYHKDAVRAVANFYVAAAADVKQLERVLPVRWQGRIMEGALNRNQRLVIDFVAGMSERELLIRHDLLLGRVSADHYEKLKLLALSLAPE